MNGDTVAKIIWFLGQIYEYVLKSQTVTVACAPAVTGSVFMRRFRLFLEQCELCSINGFESQRVTKYLLAVCKMYRSLGRRADPLWPWAKKPI